MKKQQQTATETTNQFLYGAKAPIRAWKWAKTQQGIAQYIVWPLGISIIVMTLGIWLLWTKLNWADTFSWEEINGWTKAAAAIIVFLWKSITIILGIILIGTVTRIIAAPFNEQLSVRVEQGIKGEKTEEEWSWNQLLDEEWRTIKEETVKIIVFIMIQLGLLLLNIVPVIGNITYIILGAITTWLYASFDMTDYPMARKKTTLNERKAHIFKNKNAYLGFGLVVTLIMAIPLLNLAFLPLFVIAGTQLYFEHEQ